MQSTDDGRMLRPKALVQNVSCIHDSVLHIGKFIVYNQIRFTAYGTVPQSYSATVRMV